MLFRPDGSILIRLRDHKLKTAVLITEAAPLNAAIEKESNRVSLGKEKRLELSGPQIQAAKRDTAIKREKKNKNEGPGIEINKLIRDVKSINRDLKDLLTVD